MYGDGCLEHRLAPAAQTISVFAACRDLANAPSDTSVMGALEAGLPKTLRVLEKRLNAALMDHLPRRLQRRAWTVAIDWHLVPYYGEPKCSRNEIYYGKPRQGTTKFHAYATACIVSHGVRVHFGRHLGAATRNDGHGVESPAGDNPRKRAENPTFFVGSRLSSTSPSRGFYKSNRFPS